MKKTNNYYLKQIYENTGGDTVTTHHSDNFYLKGFLENISGETVTGKHTNVYYLKRILETIGGELIADKHSNYYLRKILEEISGDTVDVNKSENHYLSLLATVTEDYNPSQNMLNMVLAADKPIISSAKGDSCVLSATISDDNGNPSKNKEIVFSFAKNHEEFDVIVSITDDSGIATATYIATGKGDITVTAMMPHISETVAIEDCYYYNDGTVNDLVCASGTTVTVENGALKITTTTSGEKKFYYPTISFVNNQSVMLELESALEDETGNVLGIGVHYKNTSSSQGYAGYWDNRWEINLNNSSKTVSHTLTAGDKIRFVREGKVSKFYHNDDLIDSQSRTIDSYRFGGYTNKDRVQRIKNIKIKAL